MAAPAESDSGDAFDGLVSGYTLTYTGAGALTTVGPGGTVETLLPPTLATATGSSPLPAASNVATRTGDGAATSKSTAISGGSSGGAGMSANVRNLLIALGCAVAFVLVLLTFFVWYRARRKTSGRFLSFCMPKRKTDSYYRQLHSPNGGRESRNGDASERKPSMQTRSDTPILTSPPPYVRPVMAPATARLNTSFIGRGGNNTLVRTSLNRHQLSTLDEHSLYEYESEQVPPPPPPMMVLHSPAPVNTAAPHSTSNPTQPTAAAPAADSNQLDPNCAVAPLQPRRLEVPRRNTHSSWTTASQPGTPLPVLGPAENLSLPTDHNMPRLRSVDHWADYQSRIAARDQSITWGEYNQAFKDRDSTADSLGRPDSTTTITIFQYHQPGEEVPWGRPDVELGIPAAASSIAPPPPPPPPITSPSAAAAVAGAAVVPNPPPPLAAAVANQEPAYIAYQPFQPPRRMHSFKKARAGPRYQYGAAPGGVVDRSSQASSDSGSSSTNTPPSPPDEQSGAGGTRRIVIDPAMLQKRHESEETVFRFHPGDEVIIDRADKIKSEDLDLYFPPSRTVSR